LKGQFREKAKRSVSKKAPEVNSEVPRPRIRGGVDRAICLRPEAIVRATIWRRSIEPFTPIGVDNGNELHFPCGHVLAAFHQVIRSQYLLGISAFVILLSWVSTFLHLEQQAYVAKIFAIRDE
jgi:hypothetical protein